MPDEIKEDEPFQKIRVTLSEVAIERLAVLRTNGYFRSDSSTIEECIRAVYDITDEIGSIVKSKIDSGKIMSPQEKGEQFLRIVLILKRFVIKRVKMDKSS